MSAFDRVRSVVNDSPTPWHGEYIASDDLLAAIVAAAQPDPVPVRPEFHVITISISAPSFDAGKALSDRVMEIKRAYSALLNHLEQVAPFGPRERALAITNLQQSCFWAVDGVVRSQLAAWWPTPAAAASAP